MSGAHPKQKKQAVLLIHGIGEQRPMATLWRFVELVWLNAPKPPGAPERKVYSEPDEVSGVFELRRLSTNYNADGKRTDFYEFYWAHLMHGNVLSDVLQWLALLALRPRASVPPQLQKAWSALRIAAGAIAFFVVFGIATSALAMGAYGQLIPFIAFTIAFVAAFGAFAIADQIFFSPVLGDAARYLRPAPKNIACRQQIREEGLRLIDALHKSGKYDRIVLVGHSLGGVIAYELAMHYWGRRNRLMDRELVQLEIAQAEAAALALNGADTLEQWRAAQSALFNALREETDETGAPLWLISDLVTLGSPLAHASTLLADSPDAFTQMLERRELASNPPLMEIFRNGARRFSYCRTPALADDPDARPRAPHNCALFAATRWTNIYFPMQGLLRGDLVGGPCAPAFGPGVKDVAACAPVEGGWFPHMHYFRTECDPPWGDAAWADHRKALREALALEAVR